MSDYKLDKYRMGGARSHALFFLYWLRLAQSSNSKILVSFCRLIMKHYRLKYGLEIYDFCRIGPGLYIGHPFNITINPSAVIGKNCNIHKGVVIGQTNRGKNKGVPTIGNEVWIGINAAIVGGIEIGDDVLIAPNTFVNCDVPPHSIVFGNPCIIKHREFATEGYINNKV